MRDLLFSSADKEAMTTFKNSGVFFDLHVKSFEYHGTINSYSSSSKQNAFLMRLSKLD